MTREPDHTESISIKVKDNLWVRSILQGIPYIGPLLDNLVTNKGYKYQQERIEKFMNELAQDIDALRGEHPIVKMIEAGDAYFMFMETVDRVRRTKRKEKTRYYKNILLNYMCWQSRDATTNLEVFPEIFLRMLDRYTISHIQTIKELKQIFDFGDTLKGIHLPTIYKQLNIPGGVFAYILFELYQDHLVSLKFENDIERYNLESIEMVLNTVLFDEFYYAVIDCPLLKEQGRTLTG